MIIDFSTAAKLLFDAGSAAHNSSSGLPYPAGAGAGAGSAGNTSGSSDSSIGKTILDYIAAALTAAVKSDIAQHHQEQQQTEPGK